MLGQLLSCYSLHEQQLAMALATIQGSGAWRTLPDQEGGLLEGCSSCSSSLAALWRVRQSRQGPCVLLGTEAA